MDEKETTELPAPEKSNDQLSGAVDRLAKALNKGLARVSEEIDTTFRIMDVHKDGLRDVIAETIDSIPEEYEKRGACRWYLGEYYKMTVWILSDYLAKGISRIRGRTYDHYGDPDKIIEVLQYAMYDDLINDDFPEGAYQSAEYAFKRNNDEDGFRIRVEKFKAELLKFMYCCAKDLYEHYHK